MLTLAMPFIYLIVQFITLVTNLIYLSCVNSRIMDPLERFLSNWKNGGKILFVMSFISSLLIMSVIYIIQGNHHH